MKYEIVLSYISIASGIIFMNQLTAKNEEVR